MTTKAMYDFRQGCREQVRATLLPKDSRPGNKGNNRMKRFEISTHGRWHHRNNIGTAMARFVI